MFNKEDKNVGEYTLTINRKPIKKTITQIGLYMFPFTKDFRRVRYKEKDKKCHLCSTPFKDKERISLAFVKGQKNHLICENCAVDLICKGVSYVDKSQ